MQNKKCDFCFSCKINGFVAMGFGMTSCHPGNSEFFSVSLKSGVRQESNPHPDDNATISRVLQGLVQYDYPCSEFPSRMQ
jgi:hypothetical protein